MEVEILNFIEFRKYSNKWCKANNSNEYQNFRGAAVVISTNAMQ
jgi:hypothetical protein